MQKEINFHQEMASEHRLQEYCKGTVLLSITYKSQKSNFKMPKSD